MNRIDAGYCNVPNPFNRAQLSRVSLDPDDIDVITFWTRHPQPLFSHLDRLDSIGYRYYFQFTVLNYPNFLETPGVKLQTAIKSFRALANLIGADRVVWRYDPIVFTPATDASFHQASFRQIAELLDGYTHRSVISFVDRYRKNENRLQKLESAGQPVFICDGKPSQRFDDMMNRMVEAASTNGMTIHSCAEKLDLAVYGIQPGKCIDSQYIRQQFGIQVSGAKDRGQRKLCGCVVSRDIGMYDSCIFGCQYCYASRSSTLAINNYKGHGPTSPSLLGMYE